MKNFYKRGLAILALAFLMAPIGQGKNNTPAAQPTKLEISMLQELEKDSLSLAKMKQYIQMGARLEVKNEKGSTPLILAAYNGNYPIALYLVKKGANVNAVNNNKDTPLILAASHKHHCVKEHIDLVKLLVANGANINYDSGQGFSALGRTSYTGHVEIAKFLIDNGAKVNAGEISPLWWAAFAGNLRMMEDLIQYGADMNKKGLINNQQVPLTWWAIMNKNIPVLSFALNHGANPNVFFEEEPLLFTAILEKQWKAVELLVLAGANVNTKYIGDTPLMFAVRTGNLTLMKYLIEHGADVNLCDDNKQTPLFYAKNSTLANYLKGKGATLTCSTFK